MSKIILASASPRRKELLEKAGIAFEVRTAGGEEIITTTDPEEAVMELSRQKAQAVAGDEEEGTLIIGADTVVVYEGRILGKPADDADAIATLKALQGNSHQVYTGVTVLIREAKEWKPLSFADRTDVAVYPMTEKEIRDYVASGEASDKAGSYGIQGSFFVYVKGICGDYNNVVGLPVARLVYELKQAGIDLRG
jgi:septum formation protein